MTDQKVVLVTGASRGIGLEISRQLAENSHQVLLSGRDLGRVQKATAALTDRGLSVHPLVLDVTQEDSIEAARDSVERVFGRLDVLVNNAGVRVEPYGRKPSEQPVALWRDTFETNLFGMVSTTTAFLPLIRRSEAGRIVNVSSLLGSVTTHSDPSSYAYSDKFKALPAYSASKSAVNSWTAHLAYELRDTPIKVNAVHPGYTKTDLNDGDGELDIPTGAATSVRMAQIDNEGPTGTYVHLDQVIPW